MASALGIRMDFLADALAGGTIGLLIALVGVHTSFILGEVNRRRRA